MAVKGKTNNPNGRRKGVPNKATTNAREAIASFVEGNVERLNGWLDAIAEGEVKDDGSWLRYPDPDGAFKAFMSVIEYNIPKLQRTDIQNLDKDGKPADGISKIVVEHVTAKKS